MKNFKHVQKETSRYSLPSSNNSQSQASLVSGSPTHPLSLAQYYFKADLKPHMTSFTKVSGYISKRYKLVRCHLITKSCPTLCDPMGCIPTGFSVHGILQARILEWGAISSSRDLPNPGIKPAPPASQADSLPLSHQGSLDL